MFNPNSTKSVFWLIVILAVVGIAVALFLRKSKKANATPSGDSAVTPNTDPGADYNTEDPDAAPAEGE